MRASSGATSRSSTDFRERLIGAAMSTMCFAEIWMVPGLSGIVALPLAGDHDVDAVIAENALKLDDVGEPRNILDDQRVLSEQARDHQRERCILCARDRNRSVQTLPANDPDPIHVAPASPQNARRSDVGTATTLAQAFQGRLAPSPWNCGESPEPENPLFERLNRHEAVDRAAGALTGCRRLAAALLRLTPAQISAQLGGQALTAAVGFLVFAGFLIFHRGAIIRLSPGVATSPPSPCVTGDRVAVSAAFYAAASGGRANSRCRSSVVEHPLGKGEVVVQSTPAAPLDQRVSSNDPAQLGHALKAKPTSGGTTMIAPNDDDGPVSADKALARLMEGNARFLQGISLDTRVLGDARRSRRGSAPVCDHPRLS